MIAKLRGHLDSTGDGWAVVDVGGVGYLVFCGARTLASLPQVGELVEFYIETNVREDHIHLYGFSSSAERETFRTLLTVQGVGAKVALAILSGLSASQVSQAIAAGDAAAFKKVGGVGPKLAARLVAELKDKIPAFSTQGTAPVVVAATGKRVNGKGADSLVDEAVSALVNLGYGRTDAFGAVTRTLRSAGETAKLPDVIRGSLQELGNSNG
ncbi:MAG: Holliday junction branch migration protein RuvA [Rhodospirillaceae bacterium]